MHHISLRLCSLLCAALLAACAGAAVRPTAATQRPIPTLFPTLAGRVPIAAPDPDTPDTGWLVGRAGVELRKLRVNLGDRTTSITVVRLDPAHVRLRVGYAPGNPQSLATWAEQTKPLLVVNGGFFDEAFRSTALIVSDGVASGTSYDGFGGMLQVAPSGQIGLQPLRDQPYDPAMPLDQALQSFPMLVFPGKSASGVAWNAERDRRTALAFDTAGRLLVIVCPQSTFSLNEFANWLIASDLQIDRALNLDGGASTGMYVDAGAAQERIDSFVRLPIVLFAEEREQPRSALHRAADIAATND